MKLKLTLIGSAGTPHDITLLCDVTVTVADVARALVSAGAGDPGLEMLARERIAPITLRGRASETASPMILDPGSPIGASGLQSGWTIEPVRELPTGAGDADRIIEALGHVEVRSGRQRGVRFSLVAGKNLVGRDPGSRVHLLDPTVSRRHVEIEALTGESVGTGGDTGETEPQTGRGGGLLIRDLGSVNPTLIEGEEQSEQVILTARTLTLGNVELRVIPGPPTPPVPASERGGRFARGTEGESARLQYRDLHRRSPRIVATFPESERRLPKPPVPQAAPRVPLLAMLAPALLGVAMFSVTKSPMSLVMVAFSPLMMIGSWLDGRFGNRRRLRRELRRFRELLRTERDELDALRTREIGMRAEENPSLSRIATAIVRRDPLLWTRRPEHPEFLELRLGEGAQSSRTRIILPEGGESAPEAREPLRRIAREFGAVGPVPVTTNLGRCGSLGIAGASEAADGLLRALVLQLAGLHSPAELTIACFTDRTNAQRWAWLKWLPHVDPVVSPLRAWQLAEDEAGSSRLLLALEALIQARRERPTATGTGPIPAILVLVIGAARCDPARLIEIAERGPEQRVHLIWLDRSSGRLPAACRTFVETDQQGARAGMVAAGSHVPLEHLEYVSDAEAQRLARALTALEDESSRALDESDLPDSVELRDLSRIDLLGGGREILRAWKETDTLASRWVPGAVRDATPLSAIVGQGVEGTISVDLREQGPHALVAGTTGSGKSEFLQTWIMSLATRLSPERISFLLVDYKGGAAFAECVGLPQTVGLFTDLTPHLVRRALTSLRAELRRREQLLAQHGAKDLLTMERRSDPATPATLVIVIDEFAALAAEVPEFVDGVIDIAQRGRSLGLHLIMATQRPAGTITDSIRANTNLRVALRMADDVESSDVIGATDAAYFEPGNPGRGALRVGPGRITHFQTGYLGGRVSDNRDESPIEVRSFPFAEGDPWRIPPEHAPLAEDAPRDIESLRDGIIEAAALAGLSPPRRPWLDPLPELIDLRKLGGEEDRVVVGLRDRPAEQSQVPCAIDFEAVGNVAILGAGGTGKSTALITIAAALSARAEESARSGTPVEIYAIDGGAGTLGPLEALPAVGAVAPLVDAELTGRVLRRVLDIVSARSASGPSAKPAPGEAEPWQVVLMIDGFSAVRQTSEADLGAESPVRQLGEIMMRGPSVGVHVVLTCDRAAAIPSTIAATIQERFVLRLADPHDYGFLGIQGDALTDAPPGRALHVGSGDEVQFAVLCSGTGTDSDGGRVVCADLTAQAQELRRLGDALRVAGVKPVSRVRKAPERILLRDLPVVVGERPVFGIDTRDFSPVSMPVSGLGVVAGPVGGGVSTALLSCVAALERWAERRGEWMECALISLGESDGLRGRRQWDRVADGSDEVKDLVRDVLAGRDPSFGSRGVIVVERPGEWEGTDALPSLVALAKEARRAAPLVLFEFESGAENGGWELFSALKRPRWGIALQPDETEGRSPFREGFGRSAHTAFPPGRGFVVETGRVAPVQIALPDESR